MKTQNLNVKTQLACFAMTLRKSALLAGIAGYSFCGAMAVAGPLSISDTPLFLTAGVKPNLIMAIDDSGSMDWEVLFSANNGLAWWRTNNSTTGGCTNALHDASFTGCVSNATGTADAEDATGRANFNFSGLSTATWKAYTYLFPNGTGTNTQDRRRLTDASGWFALPPLDVFGWARSTEFNSAYFDPAQDYQPWPDGGGFTFANSPPAAARFDPVYTGFGTIDLTKDFAGTLGADATAVCQDATIPGTNSANYTFRVFSGMVIPAGACIRRTGASHWERVGSGVPPVAVGNCSIGVVNGCVLRRIDNASESTITLADNSDVAIRYFPATFYATAAGAPPASFGYTALPQVIAMPVDSPKGIATLLKYEIKSTNFANAPDYQAAIQNFANWFTFYRKRHQALRAGLGKSFETIAAMRVAGFTINGTPANPDVSMLDIDVAANRTTLYNNFYQNFTGSGGTPNRNAVANVIRNFKRTNAGAPVTDSCQRNFGMLFTDGFSNKPVGGDGITALNVDNTIIRNADSTVTYSGIDPYKDNLANTMADHVMSAYANTIRADLPQGKVQIPPSCPDAKLDCNPNPHMNFYAITLGARGLQFNPDSPVADVYATPPTWPTTLAFDYHPSAVDDMWHAAINGHGQLLNARKSTDLSTQLSSVLNSIKETEGSAASASVNSGTVSSNTRTFKASFGTKTWSGELQAIDLNVDGTLGTKVTATIPAHNLRQITTVNTNGVGVPFQWASLDATRKSALHPSDTAVEGNERLDYLRGDQSMEIPAGPYRKRTTPALPGISPFGDIVNSSPVYVGAPPFRYKDSLEVKPYSAFVTANKDRDRMIYVGANDGLLHAFTTEDIYGRPVTERFAFVPGTVFKNLHQLSKPTYTHKFYVDGTPSMTDAFYGNDWHTVLAAGLNRGGQGVYALDVTDPSSLNEGNASSLFLFEFTDADDDDLGYTYSRPAIVRMHNGKWAMIFGNGYNNTEADTHVSATGNAALYVVELDAPHSLIRKITLPSGMAQDPLGQSRPNGLATPAVIDADGDSVVDFAYAGDVFGNLWKFDLRDASPANWDSAIKVAGVATPIFVARNALNQPEAITTRPQVGRGPNGFGQVVLFGTGKFLEQNDRVLANLVRQSFYGIFDRSTGAVTDIVPKASLQQQTILDEQTEDKDGDGISTRVRVTSNSPVNLTTQRGWYIDLISSDNGFEGEMQVSDSVLRNGRISFTTVTPNTDPCSFGGQSWFMILDSITGSRLNGSPFDLNKDKRFTSTDFVTVSIAGVPTPVPVSGVGSDAIMSQPRYVAGQDGDYGVVTDTANTTTAFFIDPGSGRVGRQSWRQLR
jgi:type IV pilus assembly protein PilY1